MGNVGNQNLGDEALMAAVIQNVRRRYPHAELRGFTRNPRDTEQRHRIPAFPIRRTNGRSPTAPQPGPAAQPRARRWDTLRARLKRVPLLPILVRAVRRLGRSALALPQELAFLARSYRTLRGTDLVLVAGSGQLNDYWGGPWAFPFTLLEWSLMARASGAKMAFLSLGAGPLRTPLGKIFIKQALRRADYRSYRDEDSRRCIAALGIPGEHLVVPDLVFSLDLDGAAPVDRVSGQRVVGINPMPFFDAAYYPESDPGVFGNYLRVLASFADGLIERGYLVRFFATQLRVDHGVIDRVRALMAHGAAAVPITSLEELIAAIDSLDIVVATRYHATLFGLLRHKPVLSIAYQRKSVDLMTQVGQARYALDIDRLTLEAVWQRFLALEVEGARCVEAVDRTLPPVRAQLERQYDRAFTLLEADS